ncbi:MAG: hypothetical protein AAF745_00980 [Planctomycetota bacterium]
MIRQNQESVADAAKRLCDEELRASLEHQHLNEFKAIEPVSGEYFLAKTLSEAIGDSRSKYPNRLAHALRIGHKAAVHFGMQV